MFEYLAWDSEFFGFKVARIIAEDAIGETLARELPVLKGEGCRLAYWFTDRLDADTEQAACTLGGFLADRKVTFVTTLEGCPDTKPLLEIVAEMTSHRTWPDEKLRQLALQSGQYSRFKIDPRFPDPLFEKLYSLWIERSVLREIARDVLVAKDGDVYLGLITVGEKNGRGDIGLVAVDAAARGKGVGKALIRASNRWFISHGYREAQVVTQEANAGACRLYESCGYRREKTEAVYHFWL